MPKITTQQAYAASLSDQLVRLMHQAVAEGLRDNPQHTEEARKQLFISWMAAHFAAGANAAACFCRAHSEVTMRDFMADLGDLVHKHYPDIPMPSCIYVSNVNDRN